jgi:hypothetical protein
VSGTSENTLPKLSEKWFEQSFDRELAGIRTSDGAKPRSLGGPKDLAISALRSFQTVSLGIPVDREVEAREAPVL